MSVPAVAPRRSARIAARPVICYHDPMSEVLERKTELNERGIERIVTQWETMQARPLTVDSIMEDMGPIDPTYQLDRFYAQLAREVVPPTDIMLENDLYDYIEGHFVNSPTTFIFNPSRV